MTTVPRLNPDGSLHDTPGYDARGKAFLALPESLSVRRVSKSPSPDEIEAARSLLLDELVGDFPFVTDADRAHGAALILLPFVRALIDGPTPVHLIEKPSPGTGGTLLAQAALVPAVGMNLTTITEGRDDDEWRKRVTATLLKSPSAVLIDNLRRTLDSAALSSAVTGRFWEDRRLGKSENVRVPVQCAWIATGNNPTLSTEMTRRSLRIRLDPKLDKP